MKKKSAAVLLPLALVCVIAASVGCQSRNVLIMTVAKDSGVPLEGVHVGSDARIYPLVGPHMRKRTNADGLVFLKLYGGVGDFNWLGFSHPEYFARAILVRDNEVLEALRAKPNRRKSAIAEPDLLVEMNRNP